MDWDYSAITGAYLEDIQGYQKGQYERREQVNMLGRRINANTDIYNEINKMIE
jgi:hypothetical protein